MFTESAQYAPAVDCYQGPGADPAVAFGSRPKPWPGCVDGQGPTGPLDRNGCGRAQGSIPVLETPATDMADMSLALLVLQDALSRQAFETGGILAREHRGQMERKQQERVEKLQEWQEKLDAAAQRCRSGGFFSNLISAVKNVFQGDFKAAAEELREGFKENPVTGGLFTAVATPLLMGAGPVGLLLFAVIFAPEIMNDPEIQRAMVESYAETFNMSRDDARRAIGIFTITTGAVWSVLSASAPTVRSFVVGAFNGEAAYKKYEADQAQADAQEAEAALDRRKAAQEFVQTCAETHLDLLRSIMESVSRNLRVVMNIILLEAETILSLNQVLGATKRI